MGLVSVTLNCSQSQPALPPPYPPNILLCHILSQLVAQNTSTKYLPVPPYPSSLPFSPWHPREAYTMPMGPSTSLQTR